MTLRRWLAMGILFWAVFIWAGVAVATTYSAQLAQIPDPPVLPQDQEVSVQNRERLVRVETQVDSINARVTGTEAKMDVVLDRLGNVQVWVVLGMAGLGVGQVIVGRALPQPKKEEVSS